ncbi:peptide-methionine (S)-S-oxide reductase MsrA [Abyssibacter profundi]|uniref:Peptide methionine sulfoxide reductase MsrA n=1 Tax=Abyssibacter profundi TaxID=2182787 RepID=A0A363ULZ1_9GAMM|nr:peptide-methionine (S)-S-oxide reductase MsrA [Abyssibacter profundi]PWN56427.1 peptide-methionine (S)-S-oxide reductase [Abyssibacter profundi]
MTGSKMGLQALVLLAAMVVSPVQAEQAIFASGCFWCTESDFEKVEGVREAVSGYIGGAVENPSYEAVSTGRTGHTEAVRVDYDPAVVSYQTLLDVYWRNVDPTTDQGQFCDKGSQYRPGIYPLNDAQMEAALASRQAIIDAGRVQPVLVEIEPATTFYVAEDHHQNYYKTHTLRYRYYRFACGRDARLKELWGEPPS